MGAGFTFKHDLVGKDACRVGIEFLSEEIGSRLRSANMKCSTVQLTIKDEYLRSIQRQRTLQSPTDIASEIARVAYDILLDEWSEQKPVRMITVTAQSLVAADLLVEQIDMFGAIQEEERERNKKREETVDKIRQKYGFESIVSGALMDSDIGIYSKNDKIERKKRKDGSE
jgi:DNA polymerase-4